MRKIPELRPTLIRADHRDQGHHDHDQQPRPRDIIAADGVLPAAVDARAAAEEHEPDENHEHAYRDHEPAEPEHGGDVGLVADIEHVGAACSPE